MSKKIYYDIIYSSDRAASFSLEYKGKTEYETEILKGENKFLAIALPENVPFIECYPKTDASMVIQDIRERRDYFDFFNLNGKNNVDDNFISSYVAENVKIGARANITFFVTYNCTYNCPFCWQHNTSADYGKAKKVDFNLDELVRNFNSLLPETIYFTGGEPTIYKDLFLLMNRLDKRIKFKITSNLGPSFNLDKFFQHVTPERFARMGFSFHPSETTREKFLDKLDRIIGRGFKNIVVESVLYDSDLPELAAMKPELEARNVILKYDICNRTDGSPHIISPGNAPVFNELLNARKCSEKPKNKTLRKKECVKKEYGKSVIICPAGYKSFHIDPLGDIYICMSALDRSKIFGKGALPHYRPIGNIQDPGFKPLEKPILCWESFRCSACDSDILGNSWQVLDRCHPPLPE